MDRGIRRGPFAPEREYSMHLPLMIGGGFVLVALCATAASAQDIAAGKKTAAGTCAVCHGQDGLAKVPDAPNLAGNNAVYLAKQLNAFKSGERKHEQMSIIAESLSDADIANLAAWFSAIKVTVTLPQ
jgi:cytochrome c553